MSADEDLHVLVVQRCHPEGECPLAGSSDSWAQCYDPDWQVLHPPTCVHPNGLADEDNPHSPSERCLIDAELSNIGDDAFELVQHQPWNPNGLGYQGIGDLLPTGRYLCLGYFEVGTWNFEHTERDDRSGITLVEGPVWAGDREGWDKDETSGDR